MTIRFQRLIIKILQLWLEMLITWNLIIILSIWFICGMWFIILINKRRFFRRFIDVSSQVAIFFFHRLWHGAFPISAPIANEGGTERYSILGLNTLHITREMSMSATGIEHVLSVYSPSTYTVCVTTQNAVLHIVHLWHLLVNPQLIVVVPGRLTIIY